MSPSHYKYKKYVARNSQFLHPDLGTAVAPFAGPAPSGCRGSATPQTFLRIPPDIVGNRSSRLTVLVHPETGHDLEDHRDRALWMGRVLDLKLDVLR